MSDRVWQGSGLPAGRIMYGKISEESSRRPGTYRFVSSEGHVVPDAILLTPDSDVSGNGGHSKPEPGSVCVAVFTHDGSGCFIIGFHLPPQFDELRDDPPVIGDANGNNISGDKVWRTTGGATFTLKRGGAAILEGGPGASVILNPTNNAMSLRAANFSHSADGYRAARGRAEIGSTRPSTAHREEFLHQVGPTSDRFRISHGDLSDDGRRRLELESVITVSSRETTSLKTRETYFDDGSWVGEGPKYQWGGDGADEAHVLGNALVDKLNELINIIKSLKVNTAWGPSSPPLPDTQTKLTQLASSLEEAILSTYMFLTKKPADL